MAPVVGLTYAVGPGCSDPTFDMSCMAATLAGGDGTRIDGETAASMLGLWNRRVRTIHATVVGKSFGAAPAKFRFHRSNGMWLPDDGLSVGPVPVAGVEQLLCNFATRATPWQLAFIIGNAIYHDLCTLASLEELVIERARVPGNATLRAAVRLVRERSSGTRGVTEDVALSDLLAMGVPVPIVNTRGSMGLSRDEPDFAWVRSRRNIEIDGKHHDEEPQLSDDRLRDGEAAALGWSVLRIAARDFWRRRTYVVQQMLRFLAGDEVELVPGSRRLLVR
jgi:hypothetical protein